MLTKEEMSLDIVAKLRETEAAIEVLPKLGMEVPEEAYELRTVMRRCIAAEQALKDIPTICSKCEGNGVVAFAGQVDCCDRCKGCGTTKPFTSPMGA